MKYLVLRIFQSSCLLVGVSLLSFIFIELSPGDFFDEMKLNPQISSETLVQLRRQYGMDQPFAVRYIHWLKSVAHGELGFSFAYNAPVAPLLRSRARNTLLLAGSATLMAWLIALPWGILSAEKHGKWFDSGSSLLTSILLATPDVLLALGLLLFAVRTRFLPTGGMMSLAAENRGRWTETKDISIHLLGPVIVLALISLPTLLRHIRAAMIEALASPCVRAARAHGIGRSRILLRHAFPVAMNPLISLFGLSLGSLLSASLLIEVVMSWPGLGPLLLESILARDVYVIIGAVMFASFTLVSGMLLGDVLLIGADPRIRTEGLL
ncbi:MAG TPA: ABC transporter permease [Candidatus Aquilonibacter sp.]|jgi:peptide/nickel transport system permease protein|nr:ABC transporter permease [Candidatus Aquilonibacter sp.]